MLVLGFVGLASGCSAGLVGNLTVNHSAANAGPYALCPGARSCGTSRGFATDAVQYRDRTFVINSVVPSTVLGKPYIQTAEGDASVELGGADLVRFTLRQSAAVYVAHDVQVPLPDWLRREFLDTGASVTNNNGTPGGTFEIYSTIYPSGKYVQLGANTQNGPTPFGMYSVILAPTPLNTTVPNAPGALALMPNCNTAAVLGLTWTASTTHAGGLTIAGYRIFRDGTQIDTVSYAQTSYQDTSVLESTAYSYVVRAFDQAGNVSPDAALNATTTAKSVSGDAAYCPSTKITGLTVDFANVISDTSGNGGATPALPINDNPPFTDGSDLWSVTQAADGDTYAFFGDGWGPCGRADVGATMKEDYTSFGFAKLADLPATSTCSPQWSNLYGGYKSQHPSGGWFTTGFRSKGGLILGKATGTVAIGNDFYAVGAAWRQGDSSNYLNGGRREPYSSPNNHQEILSSTGPDNDGAAWQATSEWDLCNGTGTSPADTVWGGALSVCPGGFVQFGAGYTGLPARLAGYVYMYGVPPATWFAIGPSETYLVRVPIEPTVKLLTAAAYQYFAGLDVNGNPIWTANGNQKKIVFKDQIDQKYRYTSADGTACAGQRVPMGMGMFEAVYDSQLGRFIATAQQKAGQVAFYEAPDPWGPWSAISYTNLSMSNIFDSGWGMPEPGGLGGGFCVDGEYKRSDGLGVHIINGATDSTGKILQLIFSSDGVAPAGPGALGGYAPPGNANGYGNSLDSLNIVQATLTTHDPRR